MKYVYKIKPYFNIIHPKNKNWSIQYQARVCSKNVCLDILRYGSFGVEDWKVPVEIKRSTFIYKAQFLRGIYDSESDVDEKHYRVGLTSINFLGLQEIQTILSEFGIRSSLLEQKTYGNRKQKFVLRIQDRKSIEIFSHKIGFTIKRKQKALQRILKNYKIYKTLREKIIQLKPQMVKLRSEGYSYIYISKKIKFAYCHSLEKFELR